jgi:nicotinate-nucleotide adenylyltransferase
VERGGPSFAVETLRSIGRKTSPGLPVFIIGHDAFIEIASWREPHELFQLAHFAVTTRPPVSSGSLADWLPGQFRNEFEISGDGHSGRHLRADTWIRLVEVSRLDISSSDIRARLRAGRSVRYLIPDSVHDAIRTSGAYSVAEPKEQGT